MKEEDPYGTWCAIASDLQRAITALRKMGVKDAAILIELEGIIDRCFAEAKRDQLLKALSIAEEALKEISQRCGPPENIAKYALEDMKGYVGGLKGRAEETANRKADPKED